MNVVLIDGDVSYPPTSGKRLRTLNLMSQLAPRHRITYIARGQGDVAQNREASAYLEARGVEVKIVDDPIPRKKGLFFYARLAANLLSPLPYSLATHQSAKVRQAVIEHASRNKVDLYQLEWLGCLNSLPIPYPGSVLVAPNVESRIWQRYAEAENNPLKRLYIREQLRKFLRFERQAFASVREVVAVSAEDATLAREWLGAPRVAVVDNGVDVEYFRGVRPRAGSRSILYLGALDWRPNLDALGLLLDVIFPAVRDRLDDARLVIVGRSPPDSLRRRLAGVKGAELHADVPDVRPFLEASAVMAVPLRIGGGSRLKILEALAAGLPVVSTKVGAEGLWLKPGEDYTLADSPEEMSRELVGCLTNPEAALAQAEHGRRTVAGRYDWSSLAKQLERVWEKAVDESHFQ